TGGSCCATKSVNTSDYNAKKPQSANTGDTSATATTPKTMIKKTGKIILWVIAIFAAIQLIPIDRANPPVDPEKDFIQVMNTPPKISGLLKRACYDCHSFETEYPRYAYVAPRSEERRVGKECRCGVCEFDVT